MDINLKYLGFKLCSMDEKINLMKTILSLKHETLVKKQELHYEIDNKKHLMIFACDQSELDNNSLLNILSKINKKNIDELDVVCENFSQNIKTNILNDIKINMIDKNILYRDYFDKSSIFPDTKNLNVNSVKLTYKDILKNMFLPQRSKSYFFCGLILIFSSIILPYFVYYLIVGTLLLIFSIICKILPKIKKNQ